MGKYSQLNEESMLYSLLYPLKEYTSGKAVEIGAIEGYKYSNTLKLLEDGILNKCLFIDKNGDDKEVAKYFVTAENIDMILREREFYDDIDLFSLDIDGNEYWVLKAMTARPIIVIVEYNRSFANNEAKTIQYNPVFEWDGKTTYYGASALALKQLMFFKGYTCVDSNALNLVFMRNDILNYTIFKEHTIQYKQKNQFQKYTGTKEFIDVSFKAFNEDYYLAKQIQNIVEINDVKIIVETGINKCETTKFFASIAKNVIGIELKKEFYDNAVKDNNMKNIKYIHGDSASVLRDVNLVNALKKSVYPVLFYLDAHWYDKNPIIEEIEAIAEMQLKKNPIIVIHDFYVPNTDLGYNYYDKEKTTRLGLELIEPTLLKCFEGYIIEYNNRNSAGSKRGCAIINAINKKWENTGQ